MYNTDYSEQLEESKEAVFGSGDPRDPKWSRMYRPTPNVKIIPCKENENGEFVPLEKRVE